MSETKEYSKETLRLQILDSANKPISEAEVTLTGIIKGIKQYTIILDKKTNSKGEIIKNITDIFPSPVSSFEIDINHKDYYPKPRDNYRRICRSYEYGHPCAAKFNAKTPKFAIKQVDIINNIKNIDDISIAKNFYESGSIIELKAIYDKKDIKPSQIKWAYKIILQEFKETSQAYTNPTQDTQNKKSESELICAIQKHQANQTIFDKINIANIYPINKDKTFSNKMIYFSDNNDKSHNATTQNPQIQTSNIYTGETLAITIPDKIHNKSTKFATLIIFAYVHKPHYKVAQIIRLNDYPQITIDCTLAETLRANARNDKISTLGWGVSYICQRLWHDNPSEAKTIDDLLYKGSRNINFLNSIPNKTVRKLVAETLPRVELREFDKQYNNIAENSYKAQQQAYKDFETQKEKYTFTRDEDKNKTIGISEKGDMIRFYIELDWEEFYMQFPLIKNLADDILHIPLIKNLVDDILHIKLDKTTYGYQKILSPLLSTYKDKILTEAFLEQIQTLIESKIDKIRSDKRNIFEMQITANLLEIAKNPKNVKIPKIIQKDITRNNTVANLHIEYEKTNHKVFSITSSNLILQENEKTLDNLKPSYLRRYQMQYYGISDTEFGKEYMLNSKKDSSQAIALYALSGKFQIYYVLDKFEVEKISENKITIYPIQIKAYIDDSFDFSDQDHTFDDNGNIAEFGQPVGAWNYNELKFDEYVSESQMSRYIKTTKGSFSQENVVALFFLKSAITIDNYSQKRMENIYPIYNHDYQNTQKYFNLGLNYILASKDFKNIKVPNEYKDFFKITIYRSKK